MKKVVVTGGAGFIGCNFVRYILGQTKAKVIVVDKLTYAGNLLNLEEVSGNPRYEFIKLDIADQVSVRKLFEESKPDCVINFAAETHVDRSIDGPVDFVHSNVVGTFVLLDAAVRFCNQLGPKGKSAFRFLHVSTDEVYGSLGEVGSFSEETPYAPNSPYAASKASADHFVRAYGETYGLPVLITNCSNNYGPYQYPEKLIPLMLLNALEGKGLPIYGDGGNVRDWLYVKDHCAGIVQVLEKGRVGEKYNIGGNSERTNLEVVEKICNTLEKMRPASKNQKLVEKGISSYHDLKTFVEDRPGHDRRYAIDATKVKREFRWEPTHGFDSGMEQTICWYLDHLDWCRSVQAGKYGRERLGLSQTRENK